MEKPFYVGSYSKQGGYFPARTEEGLSLYALNNKTGEITKKLGFKNVVNATYLAKYGNDLLLVASDEFLEPGNAISYAIQKDGSLITLSSQSNQGAATCHVSASEITMQIYVASYLDGRISVHDIKDGQLYPAEHIYQYYGKGPNEERQEHSHAHCAEISRNGKWLYVCDLGSDKIWLHDAQNLTGDFSDVIGIAVPEGYGPRHMVFSENYAKVYVICELNAHVLTYEQDQETGVLTLVEDQPTLPTDFDGVPSAAAIRIHPSRKTLYISNRTHNSIAVFTINSPTGLLNFATRFDTDGKEPRDFNIDPSGQWLVCVHQDSDTIVSVELDIKTGFPISGKVNSTVKCGTPVSIIF